MRSFFKFIAYSFVYLVFMIGSAYGAITISMNNSANQQTLPGMNGSSSPELPMQITNIVESITTSDAIGLNLSANVDTEQDDYFIYLDAEVDLSKGFENISAQGLLVAEIIPTISTFSNTNQQYEINFVYQNGKVYIDMFNGKIAVDTNNFISPLMEILKIFNIDISSMTSMDMSSMEINDILSLLSNLTETKNPDGTITLDINIEMVGMSLQIVCDENYNIKEVNLPVFELEGMTITTDVNLTYPEKVEIPQKNDQEYVESSNLLNVVNVLINHFNTDAVAFDFEIDYQNNIFNGQCFVDIINQAGKICLDIEGFKINLFYLENTIYLEYQNVFVKFKFEDIDKINTLLKENFNIELPIEEILNGDLSYLNIDFNINDLDLSLIEKVETEGNATTISIKDIGNVIVNSQDKTLSSISFNGFGVIANLISIEYSPFALQQPTENYIDISDLLPTLDNAISIFNAQSINGVINLSKGQLNIPINFIIKNQGELFVEAWLDIDGNIIKLDYYQNKIYLDCAGKFKTLIEIENLSDEIIDFLTGLDVTINTEGFEEIVKAINQILDVGVNPLLIKELTQTSNGFIIALFNDLVINLENGERKIDISTDVQELNVKVEINGSDNQVIVPVFDDNEYNKTKDIFDLAKAFINSGMLDLSIGAFNYFKDLTIGLNFNVDYQGNVFTGNVNVDIQNMKVDLSVNYQGEKINFYVIENVVYLEFRNIYLKFAFEDLGEIDNLLNTKFNIDLPFEYLAVILDIANSESVEVAIDKVSNLVGDTFDNFVLDLSIIDLDFFNSIQVNGNDTIIPIGDNTLVVTMENQVLTKATFSGLVDASVDFLSYSDNQLQVSKDSYIDLIDFVPTIENAIDIVNSNTIDGTILIDSHPIYFTIAKDNNLYAEVYSEVEGYKISMQYLNGNVYLNFADKFKLMSVVENLPNAIESFINEINLEFGEVDTTQIEDMLSSIIDPTIYPFLIKGLTQTNDGFILTLFNDFSLTLVNGSKTMTLSSVVEDMDIQIEINGNDTISEIPEIDNTEFNTIENVFDIVKGFVNSGLLDLSIGAFNYFKDLTIGLNFNVDYQGYQFEGVIYFDLQAKKLYINAIYDGHSFNIAVVNEVFYLELGNVLLKYSASNIGKIDELANNYFGVDLPLEIVDDLIKITRCTTIEDAITEIQNMFDIEESVSNQGPIDISVIDVNFFDTISRDGNNIIIPIGENTITATIENELLTNIAFSGLFEGNVKFVPYSDFTINDSNYIDLADAIPTIENAISIVQSNTISGQITIVDGEQTYPIDFVISKDGDYAEFKTVVYQANLSVQYHAGKVYICFANHVNIITTLDALPDAINKLTEGTDKETNISIEEQNSLIDILYDTIDPSKNPLLFTGFTKTENGFILSICNGVNVTLNNSTNRIDISTAVSGIKIDGYIIGNENVISVPTFNDSQYIPIENIFNFVGAIKNMSKESDFHIAGNMNIDGDLIGIGIDWVVPFDIRIKIVDGKLEAMATMGPIPTMVGVNNDVPYKADDTDSGKDRILKVYIKDNDIYMHRREKVGQFFGGGRIYEKCIKTSVESFLSDPMYYMQYALGFTDSIMGAINDAIQKSANRSAPINLNNIIKTFAVDSTGNNLTIALNMAELANNELLDVLTLNIALGKNNAGEDIISNVGLSVYMPLAEGIFTLTLTSNDIHFVDYGSPVDMTELYDYINNYKYKYDEEWEASDGEWIKASSVLYTLIFEENGGNQIANISQVYASPITLPTLSPIISENGVCLSTKTFAGWYTTSTFDEGTLFTRTTMPRKDVTLYAKWTEELRYYRSISFVTNSSDVLANVRALEGNNITLPSLGVKVETSETTITHYTFDGWYYDSELTNKFTNYIMPSEDITLYAKWVVADVETARLLQIYDNNDVIYTRYILAGETIDLSGVAKYTAGSTQLYYDYGYATVYDYSFIMPDSDLALYVRNMYTYIVSSNETGSVVEVSRITAWQNEAIHVPSPLNYYTDDGTQTSRVYYNFNGYTINGVAGTTPSVMPNYDLTLCQTWTTETKFYYTVEFDLRWYLVFGCTEGSEMKDKPTPLNPVKVLDGETLNLTSYQPTCTAYKTAVKKLFGKDQAKPFKATSWGTSPWSNYSSSGKGVTSIVVTNNTTLYACWEQQ